MLKEIEDLLCLFPKSFINDRNELILVPRTNLYFRLEDVSSVEDLIYKLIAWCSRDASKSEPFQSEWRNVKYRKDIRYRLNLFLETNFTEDEWLEIYCKFGNGCHKDKCLEFIRKDFDLSLLEE